MNNTLTLRPLYNSYIDILKCFKDGIPLSCDQLHLLHTNYSRLSNNLYDPIMRYYGISQHRRAEHRPSKDKLTLAKPNFLLHSNIIDASAMRELKHRLELLVKDEPAGITIPFPPQQFKQLLEELSINEKIFWHGNQTLTGAPYYHGGIPHTVSFQWGNLFGIIKYEEITGENEEDGNILVYFEDMKDRKLAQCIEDYWRKINLSLALQNTTAYVKPVEPQPILSPPIPQLRLYPYALPK